MGLLERLRPGGATTAWVRPTPGTCTCPQHAHALTGLVIGGPHGVGVTELLEGEKILAETAEEFFFEGRYGERRGPYEWRLTFAPEVAALVDADAPAQIDDMLFVQDGIEKVWRLDETTLAVGAPELCELGVVAAFISALSNPRVRRE